MLFFFNINPKILSQLAQVLFDPAAFLLVINMRDCNLTNQDRQAVSDSCSVLLGILLPAWTITTSLSRDYYWSLLPEYYNHLNVMMVSGL